MKTIITSFLVLAFSQGIMAKDYKYCHSQYGELEFVLPLKGKHLFMAPHSLSSSQRQIASLNSGNKSDMTQWETVHYKADKKVKFWSQKNLNFRSNFSDFIEVSNIEGKSHTFGITCTEF